MIPKTKYVAVNVNELNEIRKKARNPPSRRQV
jgi:hypothetical protein